MIINLHSIHFYNTIILYWEFALVQIQILLILFVGLKQQKKI